jgi:hypothetical protein
MQNKFVDRMHYKWAAQWGGGWDFGIWWEFSRTEKWDEKFHFGTGKVKVGYWSRKTVKIGHFERFFTEKWPLPKSGMEKSRFGTGKFRFW